MSRWPSVRWAKVALGAAVGLGLSSVALGLPWDIDMADAQQRKAYSFDMGTLPEGVVAQPALTSPKGYATNYVRGTPEGEALANPLTDDEATRAVGKRMFGTYCTPCHGDGVNLGPIAGNPPARLPGVSVLAGPNGVARQRSDGYIYLTIRNGGNIMPSYGWALSDTEMWSVVSYVRTLENAQPVRSSPSGPDFTSGPAGATPVQVPLPDASGGNP
jgi:mono/diheme cytochrome c family protein